MISLAGTHRHKLAFERMNAQWRTAPVNGAWRLENVDYQGHRLTVYRRLERIAPMWMGLLGFWRSKQAAMEAAEKAAARNAEDRLHGETSSEVVPLKPQGA